MDEVVIAYQPTFDEGRRALLGASPRTNRALIIILVGAALIAAVSVVGNNEPKWSIMLGIVELIVFVGFLVLRFWLIPRRYWKLFPGVQEPRTVTVDDQGINLKSESVETSYVWSSFSRTRETSEFFFLLPRDRAVGFAIAKRGVKSTEDEAKLRLLLESHAPLTSEDRLLRPGLAAKLVLISLIVILIMFVYVEARIN